VSTALGWQKNSRLSHRGFEKLRKNTRKLGQGHISVS
jgi:hypothetical protein